jgi:hypothetical protein
MQLCFIITLIQYNKEKKLCLIIMHEFKIVTSLTNLLSYNIPIYQQTSEVKDDVMTIAILLTQAGTDMNMNTSEFCAYPFHIPVFPVTTALEFTPGF